MQIDIFVLYSVLVSSAMYLARYSVNSQLSRQYSIIDTSSLNYQHKIMYCALMINALSTEDVNCYLANLRLVGVLGHW